MEENKKRSVKRKNIKRKQKIILLTIIAILLVLITTVSATIASNSKRKKTEVAARVNENNIVENNTENEPIIVEIENNEIEENKVNEEETNKTDDNTQKNTSGTRYRLEVNCSQNVVNVYEKDSNGEYKNCVKVMLCSIGSATPTSGTYSLKKYGGWEWKGLQGDVFGQYATQITGNILFHSVPYTEKYNKASLEYWEYDKLGTAASLGCIRLTVRNAKWIYDNCATGTNVMFYSDSNPGPLGKPTEQKISSESKYNSWDPTDADSENPWRNYGKEDKPSEPENKVVENVEEDNTNNEEKENSETNNINDVDNRIENDTDNNIQNDVINNEISNDEN